MYILRNYIHSQQSSLLQFDNRGVHRGEENVESAELFRIVSVADFRMSRSGGRILHYSNLEALFEQFAKMALDA